MSSTSAPEESTGILDLPEEILRKIGGYLPLKDRKSLSTVCRQLKDTVMMEKGILWLNSIRNAITRFGERCTVEEMIELNVLQQSNRVYRAIGIVAGPNMEPSVVKELKKRVTAIMAKTPSIKELHVHDTHELQIFQLALRMPLLFAQLERLVVLVQGEVFAETQTKTGVMQMPNLKYLEWHEQIGNRYIPQAALKLYAPKLQHVWLGKPRNLWLQSPFYRCLAQIETVDTLRYLHTKASDQIFDLLSGNPLPNLAYLCLHIDDRTVYISNPDWDRIARNLSGLRQLKLFQYPGNGPEPELLRAFLQRCSTLNALWLERVDITAVMVRASLWQRIEDLHIHQCRAMVAVDQRVEVKLGNVRKLCLSLNEVIGTLVLAIPNVRELSFSNCNGRLEFGDVPELETLFLRVPQPVPLRFLQQPLPKLRTLIIDTPQLLSEQVVNIYQDAIDAASAVQNLVLICRNMDVARYLFWDVEGTLAAVKSLKIIGYDNLSKIPAKTLRKLFKLPQLQSMLLVNLQVVGEMRLGISVPPNLVQLNTRSLGMAWNSKFLATSRNASYERLGIPDEQRLLHKKCINMNAHKIPSFDELLKRNCICFEEIAAVLHMA
ncbi:uncharacterized protein LOC118508941 [Anopheles stephensi]|uniref:uncharacterized protein LOC118508941 n=1 Tax=Anopheles stephensi TaxID=30069 RepID=UPI0016589D60|nr:uncharacterized protein LOC118508941 [Anopheles stephensi]